VTFSLFWDPQTHFRAGRHESNEKRLIYFGLRILLPVKIQLLENPKTSKIDSAFGLGSTAPHQNFQRFPP
jgi:hypothetical protein